MPHGLQHELNRLQDIRKSDYHREWTSYENCKRKGSDYKCNGASKPMHYTPYMTVQEVRMDMRDLVQDNRIMHQEIHYPLCVKLGRMRRRSEDGQARRTRGTWQYKQKMRKRLSDTAKADDRSIESQHTSNSRQYVQERPPPSNDSIFGQDLSPEDLWPNYNAVRAAAAQAFITGIEVRDTSAQLWQEGIPFLALDNTVAQLSQGRTTSFSWGDTPAQILQGGMAYLHLW